jgi:hypothetical protein
VLWLVYGPNPRRDPPRPCRDPPRPGPAAADAAIRPRRDQPVPPRPYGLGATDPEGATLGPTDSDAGAELEAEALADADGPADSDGPAETLADGLADALGLGVAFDASRPPVPSNRPLRKIATNTTTARIT